MAWILTCLARLWWGSDAQCLATLPRHKLLFVYDRGAMSLQSKVKMRLNDTELANRNPQFPFRQLHHQLSLCLTNVFLNATTTTYLNSSKTVHLIPLRLPTLMSTLPGELTSRETTCTARAQRVMEISTNVSCLEISHPLTTALSMKQRETTMSTKERYLTFHLFFSIAVLIAFNL